METLQVNIEGKNVALKSKQLQRYRKYSVMFDEEIAKDLVFVEKELSDSDKYQINEIFMAARSRRVSRGLVFKLVFDNDVLLERALEAAESLIPLQDYIKLSRMGISHQDGLEMWFACGGSRRQFRYYLHDRSAKRMNHDEAMESAMS